MPSTYAHYRFGTQVLDQLPADVRRPISRFRRMFDVGLHGPDLFFYYNILMKTPVGDLGEKYHHQPGSDFFTAVCRRHRLEPTEAGQSYLYGVLAHYCLDSVCHPFVNEATADGKVGHVEMETEFDRFLLVMDGKTPPNTYDCSAHLTLTKGECETVAGFYPGASPVQINRCITTMAELTKLLAAPRGPKKTLVNLGVSVTGDKFTQNVMKPYPNPNCEHLNEPMFALYNEAVERYAALAEQMTAHLTYNASFGEEFSRTFG